MPSSDVTTDWMPLPNGVRAARHAFVLTDIHGRADLMDRAVDHARTISTGHEMVFLGDLTDRGWNSLGCVELALKCAQDPAFVRSVRVMGNHDEILWDFAHRPESEEAQFNVIQMGGQDLLTQLEMVPEGLQMIEDYVKQLVPYHVNGGLAMVHALPDPGLPLTRQSDTNLRWNTGNQLYQGGWDKLLGGPTVLVHGHVRNGVSMRGKTSAEIEHENFAVLSLHKRICCDVGTPWTGEAGLFEFVEDQFRIHAFIEGAKR